MRPLGSPLIGCSSGLGYLYYGGCEFHHNNHYHQGLVG